MANDHFIRHKWTKERTDWNFNILFNDQPQVAHYAAQYKPLLDYAGLYQPVPAQWLHATVLRVGKAEDFTEAEMLEIAKRLEPKFASLQMPEFLLGQWWIWEGNPCVHFTPEGPLIDIFNMLVGELAVVVGSERSPQSLKFTPHITLAYSKTYDDEIGLFKQLQSKQIAAMPVRAKRVSLINQYVINNYYAWDIVREIPLGQR